MSRDKEDEIKKTGAYLRSVRIFLISSDEVVGHGSLPQPRLWIG